MELTPTQKYDYPVSTSMDYGWFVNHSKYSIKQAQFPDDKENKPRWHYALSQTDVTRFIIPRSKPKTTSSTNNKK